MLSKFSIDYSVLNQHENRVLTHQTDDPIAAEEFLTHLLTTGARIHEIRHEGVTLTQHQFDRMIKMAAETFAASLIRSSLGIDPLDVKYRFGYAA